MKETSSNPSRFLLIRHAQTMWNREHRHTGNVEIPLSDYAEDQISRLTKRLVTRQEPPLAIYSSSLSRCQLTILPTADALNLEVSIREDLVERDLGDWEGKSPEDLLPTHPDYVFPQSAYTGEFHIPHAETIEALEHRIREALKEIHHAHPGETVAICTHSGVIWTIIHRIVTNPPNEFFWPGNCSITTVTTEGNHFHFASYQA